MPLLRRIAGTILSLAMAVPLLYAQWVPEARAAASMYVSAPSSVVVGNNVTVSVYVNTGGSSANTFQGTLSYPAGLFEAIRGSTSGSVCSIFIKSPDPSGGSAGFSCGTPGGYTGTSLVISIVLLANTPGSGSFGLSGCTVLGGPGIDMTGGCSGASVTVSGAPTPAPTAAPTPVPVSSVSTPPPAATSKSTPKPTATPANNVQQTKTAETPAPTPVPTAEPTPPPAEALPVSTATPTPAPSASASPEPEAPKRSVSQAFRDMFASIQSFKLSGKDASGTAAIVLTLLPFMALLFAIVFFAYRLFLLERRRHRTMDRLFEMELSELAALEGKMDLLAEKGTKGRDEYREEFEKAKEHILRQLRPDYGKPVDAPAQPKKEASEAPPPTPPTA